MNKEAVHAVIYSKTYCPYCEEATNILDRYSDLIEYDKKNIESNKDNMDEMIARFEKMAKSLPKTVPQIFINDKYVGGCDDLRELVKNPKWLNNYL
ncbi:glutaredoxin 3 [Anaplasmataceae bacterium AB001_6]|nr:glutaredoxin 3 [Anaplasmataceae bacterium AB001_6]